MKDTTLHYVALESNETNIKGIVPHFFLLIKSYILDTNVWVWYCVIWQEGSKNSPNPNILVLNFVPMDLEWQSQMVTRMAVQNIRFDQWEKLWDYPFKDKNHEIY